MREVSCCDSDTADKTSLKILFSGYGLLSALQPIFPYGCSQDYNKNIPVQFKKGISPLTIMIKDTLVKPLTGHADLQTRSIFTVLL